MILEPPTGVAEIQPRKSFCNQAPDIIVTTDISSIILHEFNYQIQKSHQNIERVASALQSTKLALSRAKVIMEAGGALQQFKLKIQTWLQNCVCDGDFQMLNHGIFQGEIWILMKKYDLEAEIKTF